MSAIDNAVESTRSPERKTPASDHDDTRTPTRTAQSSIIASDPVTVSPPTALTLDTPSTQKNRVAPVNGVETTQLDRGHSPVKAQSDDKSRSTQRLPDAPGNTVSYCGNDDTSVDNASEKSPSELAAGDTTSKPKLNGDTSGAATSSTTRQEKNRRLRANYLEYLNAAWEGPDWLPMDVRERRRYQTKEISLHTLSNIHSVTRHAIRLGYPLQTLWQPGGILRTPTDTPGMQLRAATSQALAAIKATLVESEFNASSDSVSSSHAADDTEDPDAEEEKDISVARAGASGRDGDTNVETSIGANRSSLVNANPGIDGDMRGRSSPAIQTRIASSRRYRASSSLVTSNEDATQADESVGLLVGNQQVDTTVPTQEVPPDRQHSFPEDLVDDVSFLSDEFDASRTPARHHHRLPRSQDSSSLVEFPLPRRAGRNTSVFLEQAKCDNSSDDHGGNNHSGDEEATHAEGIQGTEMSQSGRFHFSQPQPAHLDAALRKDEQQSGQKRKITEDTTGLYATLAQKALDQLLLNGRRMSDDVVWLVSQALWLQHRSSTPPSVHDRETLMDPLWFRAYDDVEKDGRLHLPISTRVMRPGQTVYAPLHLPQVPEHWALLVIRVDSTATGHGSSNSIHAELRDSASRGLRGAERINLVQRRLIEAFQPSPYSSYKIQTTAVSCPQQSNGWSCGRHMLANLQRALQNQSNHQKSDDLSLEASAARLGEHLLDVLLAVDVNDLRLPNGISQTIRLLHTKDTRAVHKKRPYQEILDDEEDRNNLLFSPAKRRVLDTLRADSLDQRITSILNAKERTSSTLNNVRSAATAASRKLSEAQDAFIQFEKKQLDLDKQVSAIQSGVFQGIATTTGESGSTEDGHEIIHDLKLTLHRACNSLFREFNTRLGNERQTLELAIKNTKARVQSLQQDVEDGMAEMRILTSKEEGLMKLKDIGNKLRELDGTGGDIELLLQTEG